MINNLKVFDIKRFYVSGVGGPFEFIGAIVYRKSNSFEILTYETGNIEEYAFISILDAKRVKLSKKDRGTLEHNAKMWNETLSKISKTEFLNEIQNSLDKNTKFNLERGKLLQEGKLKMNLFSGDGFSDTCIEVRLNSSIDIQKISPSSRNPENYINNLSKKEYQKLVNRYAGKLPKIKEKKNKKSVVKFRQRLKIEDRKWLVLNTDIAIKLKENSLTRKNAQKIARLIEFED